MKQFELCLDDRIHFLFCYGTTAGMKNFDSIGYHLQTFFHLIYINFSRFYNSLSVFSASSDPGNPFPSFNDSASSFLASPF